MKYDQILARLHLHAVLPLLEEIVAADDEASAMVARWDHTIQFHAVGGIGAHLTFRDGSLQVGRGKIRKPTIALWFKSAADLNRMFTGDGFVLPIVWKGLWHPMLLRGFTKLSKRLEHYMRAPEEKVLGDEKILALVVKLQLYAMVFGLKEVGENDPAVSGYVKDTPNGTAEFRIMPDGPVAHLSVRDGLLSPSRGPALRPNLIMEIKDYRVAYELFQGRLDTLAAVGACDIKLRGQIPIIDGLSPSMDRLDVYLS
ncbi:hypothetical protein ACFL4G_12775 [Thermodesulfobacteriota bacterium]